MVSLWPFSTGDSTSTSAFEKTLSTLQTKITRASQNDTLYRARLRRYKGLFTLYTSFIYILYVLLLALGRGWQSWGPVEYSGIAGAPVVIYGVRYALSFYYETRISRNSERLEKLRGEKDEVVEKFKTATKFNSTQQLLEKYGADDKSVEFKEKVGADGKRASMGGSSSQQGSPRGQNKAQNANQQQQQQGREQQVPRLRTGIAPPATANIPSRRASSNQQQQQQQQQPNLDPAMHAQAQPGNPQATSPMDLTPTPANPYPNALSAQSRPGNPSQIQPTAEFAPNADAPQQYLSQSSLPSWSDRLMNVLLGEDETQPINRFALICGKCRLVNGQAPPGTTSLEEVGAWRCGGCGGWNGEKRSEVAKALGSGSGSSVGREEMKERVKVEATQTEDSAVKSEED